MGDLHLTPEGLDWLRQFVDSIDTGFRSEGVIEGSLEKFNTLTEKVKQLAEVVDGSVRVFNADNQTKDSTCELTIVKQGNDDGDGYVGGPLLELDEEDARLFAQIFALSEYVTCETFTRYGVFNIVWDFSVAIHKGEYK